MISYPEIDPVIFQIGPLKVHWYGIMYLIGFLFVWWLGTIRAKLRDDWSVDEIGDVVFYGVIGTILGGRLGYTLFYNLGSFLSDPVSIFKIWEGGMSFHGGLIGVICAMWLYSRKRHKPFLTVTDFIAPMVPIGLGAGRIGNFINGELWGRVTDVPWAMVFPFPQAGNLPRHPSQLYEAFFEGLVLFLILWFYSRIPRPAKSVSGLFLLCYGSFRFLIEFTRMPDAHLSFIAFNWMTMGQLLSIPMVIFGAGLLWWSYKKP